MFVGIVKLIGVDDDNEILPETNVPSVRYGSMIGRVDGWDILRGIEWSIIIYANIIIFVIMNW